MCTYTSPLPEPVEGAKGRVDLVSLYCVLISLLFLIV